MRFSILLLLVSSATSSFGFVPSARAQISAVSKPESDSFAKDTNTVIPSSTSLCNSNQVDSTTMSASIPKWFQKEISITAPSRGCHLITSEVNKVCSYHISTNIVYDIILLYDILPITYSPLLLPYLYYYHIRLYKKICRGLRLVWQIYLSSIPLLRLQSMKMQIQMWYVFLDLYNKAHFSYALTSYMI